MWCDRLRTKGWTGLTCPGDMSLDEPLECVGAQSPSIRTREDIILWVSVLLGQPFFQGGGNITTQRRASHFAALSQTPNMSTGAELHVLAAQGCDLTVTQTSLNGNEQQRPVPSSDP